jgi:DNA polymerase-3 subunit epsilon
VEAHGYLIKPVGGHAPFQSKIHGLTDEHTFDKPDFGRLFPEIRHLFTQTLVAHSLFDRQVLRALCEHFGLDLQFAYVDTSAIAKAKLPDLGDHKLKTLVKHFRLPNFRHHDAKEDAVACANVCLRLHENEVKPLPASSGDQHELKGMIAGILADDEINYKEAYELLYWLHDHPPIAARFGSLHRAMRTMLEDDKLDSLEAAALKTFLRDASQELSKSAS